MAKQLNVELGIRANASQAKQEIQGLMTTLNSISIKGLNSTEADIQKASQAAKELAYHLNNAFDASTGKLDLSSFDASLKKSNSNIQELAGNLLKSGSLGQTAFLQLSQSISQANFPMVKLNSSLKEMMTTLKNTARWQLSSSMLHGFMGAVQSAYGYAQNLNASLNDIRIVTGKSANEMDQFAKKANSAAQALSSSTLAYTKASLIYYQQGLSAEEVEQRANVTIKMANVTKDSAEDVSSYMTAIWNNFDDGSKSLEYYADVMAKLGAATAASTSEIAEGLEKFASIGETVGLSYEYATATVATVVDKTRQSADTIGTAFKTIFSRLQGLQLGETLDDGTTLNKYSSALQTVGISIKDSNGELRDMDNILDDLGEKWATLHKDEKMALAQTVAGTRQYTQLISLMDNYDAFKLNVSLAENSEGELQNQADIYAESWEGARNRVQASLEEIYGALLDDKFFIKLTNGFANLIHGIDNFIDAIGGVKGVVIGVGSIILSMLGDKIGPALNQLKMNILTIFTGAQTQIKKFVNEFDGVVSKEINRKSPDGSDAYDTAQKQQLINNRDLIEARMKLSMASKKMTDQEKQEAEFILKGIELHQKEAQAIADKIVQLEKERDAIIAKENVSVKTSEGKGFYDDTVKSQEDDVDYYRNVLNTSTNPQGTEMAATYLSDSRERMEQFKDTAMVLDEALRTSSQNLANYYEQHRNGTIDLQAAKDQALQPFVTMINELDQKMADGSGFESSEMELTAYKEQLELIIRAMPKLGSGAKEVDKALSKALKADSIEELQQALNGKGGIKDAFKGINVDVNDLIKGFKRLDPKKFQELEKNLKQAQKEGKSLEEQQKLINEAFADFNPQHTVSGLERITSAAAGFGQVSMLIGSFKSLIGALNDEDMSFGDKLTTVLTSISMMVPSALGAINNLKTAFPGLETHIAATTGKILAFTLAKKLDTTQDALGLATKLGLTAALQAEGVALDQNTAKTILSTMATELKNGASFKSALSTGLSAAGISAETVAKVANTVATGAATAAQWAFNAAFYASPIGWVAALIIGLIAALTALIVVLAVIAAKEAKVVETEKNAGEAAAKATEQYNQLKEAYDSLKQSIEDYDDALKAFQELEKGSKEYAEALEKVNEQAEKLIETYPELANQWSYGQNGEIVFDTGALDQVAAQQEASMKIAEAYMNGANSRHIAAQRDLVYQNTGYKSEKKQAKLDALGNLTDAQYNAIKNMGDLTGDALTDFAEGIGLTADEVTSLSEVIKDLGSDADSTHAKLQSLNNQEEYYAEQQARSMVQFQGLYEGNVNAQNAYANLLAQNEDYQNKINENAKKANKGKEKDIKALLAERDDKWHDYNDGWGSNGALTDKELMQAYAQYVEGWSKDELDKAVYDGGNGKGKLSTEGKDDLELTDDYMRQALTAKLLSDQMISEGADKYNTADIQKAVDAMLQASQNVSDIMLNSFSNYSEDGGLNFDYSLFSEDEKNEMLEVAKQMGGEYGKAVEEALANYDEQFYLDRLEDVQNANMDQTIEKEGLDADAIELQTELLQDNTEALKDNKNAAKQLAINNARMNKGMSTLIDNWKDWSKVLKSGDKTTTEYAETLADMQSCIGDLVGLSDEMEKSLSADFLGSAKTIKLLERAANADAAAVEELGFAVANDLVSNMQIADSWIDAFNENELGVTINGETYNNLAHFESAFNTTKANVLGYINEISNASLGVGESIGNAIGPENVQDFVDGLNEMAMATNMSVESMQGMLSSMGVEATVENKWVDEPVKVPTYRTEKKRVSWNPFTGESVYDEFTYQTGEVTVDGGRYVASVAYDGSSPNAQINYVGHGNASTGNKKAAANNNGGGGGGGGDKSPKDSFKSKAKDKKNTKDETERYHEITNALESVGYQLDEISKKKDRAFGKNKLKLMDEEAKKLKEQIGLQEDYLKEIEQNAKSDYNLIHTKYGLNVDENGDITNYDETVAKQVAAYNDAYEKYIAAKNAAVDKYNSSKMEDGDEKTYDAAIEAADEEWEAAQDAYAEFQDDMAQYEESVDLFKESEATLQDMRNQLYDLELEKIDYKVQLQIDVEEDSMKVLDFLLGNLEDNAHDAAEAISILTQQTESAMNNLATYEKGINDLFANHGLGKNAVNQFLNGTLTADDLANMDFTEAEVEKLREYRDGLLDETQNLIDYENSIREKVLTAWDDLVSKMDTGIEKLDHLTSMTESYKNIVGIVGKDMLGISDELMKSLDQATYDTALNKLEATSSKLDAMRKSRQEAEDALAQARKEGNEDLIQYWEDTIQTMDSEIDAAEEEFMGSWEESLQAAADMFANETEAIINEFSEKMAGAFGGTLEELQSAFDKQRQINELYVDDYKKIYELSKLSRDISKSLDDTDNIKGKQALLAIQEEINKAQEEGVEMSEYEIENLRRKYELEMAKMQLDEAKNTKSTVRMSRDNNGNWGYVYTADQDGVAAAEQNYEDKLYAMQQANSDYIKELEANILQAETEMMEAMRSIDATQYANAEEYYKACEDAAKPYYEMMEFYTNQMNLALGNNKQLYNGDWKEYSISTGYKISANEDFMDSFSETLLGQMTGYRSAEGYLQAHIEAVGSVNNPESLLGKLGTAYNGYKDKVDQAMKAAGTSTKNFKDHLDGYVNDEEDGIAANAEKASKSVEDAGKEMKKSMDTVISDVSTFSSKYSSKIQTIISKNTQLANSLNSVISKWSQLNGDDDSGKNNNNNNNNKNNNNNNNNNKNNNNNNNNNKKSQEAAKIASDAAAIIKGVHNGSIAQTTGGWVPSAKAKGYSDNAISIAKRAFNDSQSGGGYSYCYEQALKLVQKYDTGGYTGVWGDQMGRLAMLHQKELVLNEHETKDMLQAIEMVREISSMIDLNAMSASQGLSGYLSAGRFNDGMMTIQQEVTIHAEFPDVSDRNEIKEAFGDLINMAAQYANRIR